MPPRSAIALPALSSDIPRTASLPSAIHTWPNGANDGPEAHLNAVVHLAPIVVYRLDLDGTVTFSEGRALAVLGLRDGEVVGRTVFELYAGYPEILADVQRALAGEDLAVTRRVGDLWFETHYTPLFENNRVCGTLAVATDVTERQRALEDLAADIESRRIAEERLARSEAGFRALIDCSADAIAVKTDGRLSYVNQALVQYVGARSRETLLRRSLRDLFVPGEWAALSERLSHVVTSGEPSAVFEHRLLRSDGHELTAQVAIARVSFAGKPSALVTLRDVTERRRMQAQLRAADHMATVGTLTASIAHEINNPLAALIGNLELLEGVMQPDAVVSTGDLETLRDAREAAARIRHIVKDLRSFTHHEDEKRVPLDVSRVLDSALKLAVGELGGVSIVKDYRVIPLVDANDVRLGQVFLNLVVNAAQSFGEVRPEHATIRIATRSAASQVIVEITDNGSGIAPSIMDRIFDPLFTTKPIGVGTGLGLAICRGIVGGLGGAIQVKSELGQGTTFRITLPASTAAVTVPRSVWPPSEPFEALRVLVIDDEAMIRRILRRALERNHEVSSVASVAEALQLIRGGAEFDVVFCDLLMPEVTGMQLHELLCSESPELAEKMVFMSGGVFSAEARVFLDRFSDRHLPKPFDLRQVEGMLEARARQTMPDARRSWPLPPPR